MVRALVPNAVESKAQRAFLRAFRMEDPLPDPVPWNRPDGVDVYVGVVLRAGDHVLLRRLNRHGYRYTFPRLRTEADTSSRGRGAADGCDRGAVPAGARARGAGPRARRRVAPAGGRTAADVGGVGRERDLAVWRAAWNLPRKPMF